MGVDHDASFGIGYEIIGFPDVDQHDEEDDDVEFDPCEFLDEILKGSPYSYAEWGDGSYSGDENTFAVVLDKIDPSGNNTLALTELRIFCCNKGLKIDDSTYLVGGVHTW